ncbi:RNA pseudouridine synthase [Leptospira perolatii]|uniref:RNA pseudouridine synthase n=1 Tax=Leptospira perolatii TaxID=2023191 RepID=A0A2M9ZPV3_9LEPT|nr:RNA pseudouridine synthase [Leptospira perolatii]PJZ69035.1 RNA pseudouridine synthase [Leptospira perolatii]PJZ74096.1 RNA pseudouridine synthase [Leptospira perolatii]
MPTSQIKIHYRGNFLLLAEKPAGIPVHATLDQNRQNFADLLQEQENLTYLRLVNRLDLETSGLVLFCTEPERNKEADEILRQSEKMYLCVVEGVPSKDEFREECFLKDGKGRVQSVRSGGKKAITEFKVLSRNSEQNLSLLEAKLITGRRHQIRFQISTAGFPILGDKVYNSKPLRKSGIIERCLLHSYRLTFRNEEGTLTKIVSPPNKDFRPYLQFFPGISF